MMNPNILNQNPLMFFDRAVNAQRSQLLTVMADAVSECRTAADQAAELNETGQVGLLRLAEVWSTIRAKEGMGGLVLEGTEAKILSDVVAQFYAYLSGCMFNDPVGMAIYAELHYMMSSLMLGECLNKEPRLRFTDEERSDPALEKPIRKVEKAAARADKAQPISQRKRSGRRSLTRIPEKRPRS